jgi:tRNA threonylcarbamoyladenosine biosynthesis protein TsaE
MGAFAGEVAAALVERASKHGYGTDHAAGSNVLALSGELGAGKTTFVKALVAALGIDGRVQSPTFVIMRRFDVPAASPASKAFDRVVHVDAYRLESPQELARLGFAELCNDPRTLVALEWPEQAGDLVPPDATKIALRVADDDQDARIVMTDLI